MSPSHAGAEEWYIMRSMSWKETPACVEALCNSSGMISMDHGGDKKETTEESKVPIFCARKYKVGVDHTAWNRAYARDVTSRLGIHDDEISELALDHLMANVTQVVRDVLMTATRFSIYSRRTRLEACDVESAINLPFTSSHAESNTQFFGSDGLSRSLYPDGRYVVDLRSIMNMPPRRMPSKRRLRKHWLVIDGEQPRVPENPIITPLTSSSVQDSVANYQNSSADSLMDDGNRLPRTGNKLEQSASRPFTTHSLSMDQQIFFKKCVETVMGSCPEKRR
ncbi:hypothetical protein KIN20_028245, partial [Parelaphostrongylus tenuis]